MADDTRAEDHHGLGSLSVRSRREGDAQVVELIGELDLDGASAVEAELLAAEATDAALIVVDLGGLEFIDSTGIRLIVMAAERRTAASRSCVEPSRCTGYSRSPISPIACHSSTRRRR